jgi:hypothetical protein
MLIFDAWIEETLDAYRKGPLRDAKRRSALLNAGFQDFERHQMMPRNLVLKEHTKVHVVDCAISDTTARINCNLEPGYSV